MTETVIATGPIKVFHNNVWRMNRDDLRAITLFETCTSTASTAPA